MSTNKSRSYQRPSAKGNAKSGAKGRGRAQAARSTRTSLIAGAVAVVLVVSVLVWFARKDQADTSVLDGLVQAYASEGNVHVPFGQTVNYRSNPPHSGPHYEVVANPGFYRSQIPDEVLVHNLEHGHVILYYKPGSLTADDEQYVASLANTYTGTWAAFLAVPRSEMDHPLVLAAWRHLLPLETLDRQLVEAFVDRYIGRGPENPVR